MTTPSEIARAAWGGAPPDWVLRMAEACEATSQAKVARKLGYSDSVVSAVLRRKYAGRMDLVEEQVRGHLMAAVVDCPQLGRIGTPVCRDWRDKAGSFSGHNALRVAMFRACTRCPRFLAANAEEGGHG